MRFFVILGLFATIVLSVWIASAAPDKQSDQRQEQERMIEAAGKAYEASCALWQVGAGEVTVEAIYTWSRRWAEAEAEGAAAADQLKAYTLHRDRMRNLLATVSDRRTQGLNGGQEDRYQAARYYLAEADYLLLKRTPDNK